ncbi:hypothetical protein CI610_01067 [invertebrate metagenome]|uniref:C4-dicarboxylate ABC transporter substrate-binding protein n=1 Tax=invertebrate metagenome TaxID=1711999 RepID=A0A2H9T9K8_9ZZZZ
MLAFKKAGMTAVVASAVFLTACSKPETSFVTIGTGGVTGVYYPAGGAICRLVNKNQEQHNIQCSVESTGGSIYNLNTIRSGEMDTGIVQSDWQYHAYHGSSKFEQSGANENLRAVFSLHPEAFTIVARQDANIHYFEDLKDKRVNIGNPGSGHRATLEQLMAVYRWDYDNFKMTSELKPAEMAKALCDNKIDAFTYTVGHPNAAVQEALSTCDASLVSIAGDEVDELLKMHPYYRETSVPAGMYGDNRKITTFGVAATLVSSTEVPEETIYQVTKAVFEQFDSFKQLHPAFANLTQKEMVAEGISIPHHSGAQRYYKEAGLMK